MTDMEAGAGIDRVRQPGHGPGAGRTGRGPLKGRRRASRLRVAPKRGAGLTALVVLVATAPGVAAAQDPAGPPVEGAEVRHPGEVRSARWWLGGSLGAGSGPTAVVVGGVSLGYEPVKALRLRLVIDGWRSTGACAQVVPDSYACDAGGLSGMIGVQAVPVRWSRV
ncbi:MAG: hypothetical protein GWN71_27700, partial [Gammaproteobacteria bacterium]|nr:hypothetical protein [Gammaproteobacteria bacterium]NIW35948.1 hypothetical protein [Gemmatimonadota bacterium]NIY10814.1 hypothetical protein [Gemmatimonadota bacterium]